MASDKKRVSPVRVSTLHSMKASGEKIAMLTAYDASFARVLDRNDVDVILVGDSLGMVIQGHDTTVPVTVDDMVYHSKAVARAIKRPLLITDLPFLSYSSPQQAIENAARLMQEGGAHMVKLEGGLPQVETVRQLTYQGIAVCAHLGLTPQSVHKLGGYRIQGREDDDKLRMIEDALALEDAGADAIVLECIPTTLAAEISQKLTIPTIGIGAGVDCDGQVLVLQDMIGLTPKPPKFVKNFMEDHSSIDDAVSGYVNDVKNKQFPELKHTFS